MAFGAIELTTISRAQDYTTIKHNEDNKVNVDQTNFSQQFQKTTEQNIREVHSSDDTQWHEKRPDAKEKGNARAEQESLTLFLERPYIAGVGPEV